MNSTKVLFGLALRVLAACVAFLLNVVVVRILGVEEAADFFYLVTLSSAFSAIFTLGFYNFLQSKTHAISVKLFNVYLQVSLLIFPINIFLMLCIGFLIGLDLRVVIIASFSSIPLSILSVYAGFLNKTGRYFQSVFYQNIATQLLFFLTVLLVKVVGLKVDAGFIMNAYLICAFLSVVPCFVYIRSVKLKFSYFKYTFASSLPFFIVILSAQLYMWGVNFTSMYSLSKEEYSALVIIQRVAFAIAIVVSVIDSVASPSFNRMHREGQAVELVLAMKKFTVISLVLGIFIFLSLLLFNDIILALFSDSLVIYQRELILVCLAQLLNCSTGPTGSFLMMVGEQRAYKNIVFWISVSTLCISLPAGLIGGLLGVSLILFLSSFFQNCICVLYIRYKFGFITFMPSVETYRNIQKLVFSLLKR